MAYIERQKQLTKWSLEKCCSKCTKSPVVGQSGLLEGLRGWILDNVTSNPFSGIQQPFNPAGFAGAADGLLDINGAGPFVM